MTSFDLLDKVIILWIDNFFVHNWRRFDIDTNVVIKQMMQGNGKGGIYTCSVFIGNWFEELISCFYQVM